MTSRTLTSLRRPLLALGGVLLALVLAELGLFLLGHEPLVRTYPGEHADVPQPHFRADPQLGWRMKPGARFRWETEGRLVEYRADAEGFRGPRRATDPAQRPHRIALVGDSFTWGLGVTWEESFAGRLEALLPRCEVRVFAQPGWGLDQMLFALEGHALAWQPDLVVVAIYPDDLDRSFEAYRHSEGFNKPRLVLEGGELRAWRGEDLPNPLLRWLDEHSRLLALGRRGQRHLGRQRGVGAWWRLNAAILERMSELASGASTPLVVLHIPQPEWQPLPALAAHLRERGQAWIDLESEDVTAPRSLYFPVNRHLNPQGHRFVAEVLQRWIASHAPQLSR